MIAGFGKYLIDKGFKRFKYEWIGHGKEKKQIEVEDYENEWVSTYGPLEYCYKKDDVWCYWGLYIAGNSPKFFIIDQGNGSDYFDISDYDKALQFITENSNRVKRMNENATEAVEALKNLDHSKLRTQVKYDPE